MTIDAQSKSLFIFPAFGIVSVLLIVAIVQAYLDWNHRVAWIGVILAALPLPILLTRLVILPVPRTSEYLPSLYLLAGIGIVVVQWQQFIEYQASLDPAAVTWVPTALASLAVIIFVAYLYWYSRFGRIASGQLSVGNKLPIFELNTSNGDAFHSESLHGAPAIILFFRGNWCPLCMAQIEEIADRYKDLEALGVAVILISPQSETASRQLASRYAMPFKFLIDVDNALADSLEIGIKNGVPVGISGDYLPDTVMPTLIVTNGNGTIIFSDQTDNYRVRPEPDVFLAILRRSAALVP